MPVALSVEQEAARYAAMVAPVRLMDMPELAAFENDKKKPSQLAAQADLVEARQKRQDILARFADRPGWHTKAERERRDDFRGRIAKQEAHMARTYAKWQRTKHDCMVMEASDKALDVLDPIIVDLYERANPGKRRKAAEILDEPPRRSHKARRHADNDMGAAPRVLQPEGPRVPQPSKPDIRVKVEQDAKPKSKQPAYYSESSDISDSDGDADMRDGVEHMRMPPSPAPTVRAAA